MVATFGAEPNPETGDCCIVPRIDDAGLGYAPGRTHHDVGRDDRGCIAFAPLLPGLQAGPINRLLLGFGQRAECSEFFRFMV